ncbi:MAG TPA: CAP domain-containing protein [Rhizomicrobium sp.]|jgi:uncharacterized protein YkwD|nr:CAP domain-containing protein [Rhizomicrobium sp.]
MARRFLIPAIFLAAISANIAVAAPTVQAETLILQGISKYRATLAPNAPALTPDATLAEIARSRAQAMASGAAPMGHQDAKGNYPAYDAVRARMAPFNGVLGENIAAGSGLDTTDANELASDTIEHWMASPGHRGNILSPGFDRVGIGAAVAGDNAVVVAVFAGPPAAR